MIIYTRSTKKFGKAFRWEVTEITIGETLKTKIVKSGILQTRAMASNMAKRFVRAYNWRVK